jgi:CRP-like cAMP-binding protein
MCLKIDPKFAPAYFNRSGLYKTKGNIEAALADINQAIMIEPANVAFRTNRSILFRNTGSFMEAVQDTLLCKALSTQPGLAKNIENGAEIRFDDNVVFASKVSEDPIIVSLGVVGEERTEEQLEPIVDFLKTCKFFAAFASSREVFAQVASKISLQVYKKGKFIFQEREIGRCFYVILDGEVSIVKVKKQYEDITDTTVLVKMYRGQSFGETALDSKEGVRTAGAMASQLTRLLVLGAEEYQAILSRFKSRIKEEVQLALRASSLFQDWDRDKLDHLASFVIVRSFGANSEVLHAGDKVLNLMMIKSGIVKLIKQMARPNVSKIQVTTKDGQIVHEELDESPGLWVLDKNWRNRLDDDPGAASQEQVEFTVGILGSGQVFGELAVLDPEQASPVTAISCTAVELYCFESDVLLGLGVRFNNTTMNALNESLNLHDPPAEKVSYYFRSKYNWEIRKNMLMNRLSKSKN